MTAAYRRLRALVALLALMLAPQTLLGPGAGADILYDPAGPNDTAITVMAFPSGPILEGTPVILVAQVAPARVAGTVQFKDGERRLGPPQPVIDGFALAVTSKLTDGSHLLTAIFTAANRTTFGSAMSPPLSLSVIRLS